MDLNILHEVVELEEAHVKRVEQSVHTTTHPN